MNPQEIALDHLEVSRLNTRKDLSAGQEDSGIQELANSIGKQGLLAPLLVRPLPSGTFEVISGQRRLKACKLLGLDPVPCLVRDDLDDADTVTVSLVENIHRADMNPLDKAEALGALYEKLGSYKRVAEETGWSSTTVSKYVALMDLPPELRDRLGTSEGAARVTALSKLARTFSGEDALEVYARIGGFNQRIQQEILRRSEGSLEALEVLATEAQEGAFDSRSCGGVYGCSLIKDILEGDLDEEAFEEIVEQTAKNLGARALERNIREQAREFWGALARW